MTVNQQLLSQVTLKKYDLPIIIENINSYESKHIYWIDYHRYHFHRKYKSVNHIFLKATIEQLIRQLVQR